MNVLYIMTVSAATKILYLKIALLAKEEHALKMKWQTHF